MILLNGRKYVRNASELAASLVQSSGTAAGFYRVNRGRNRISVSIFNLQKDPVALVSPDGVLVTAFRYNRQTRYMYALTESTKRELGLQDAPHNALYTIGHDILRQIAA